MRRSAAVAANRNDRLIQDKRHIRQIQQCIGDITRGEHVHAAQYNGPNKSAQLVANSPLRAKRVRRRRNERVHEVGTFMANSMPSASRSMNRRFILWNGEEKKNQRFTRSGNFYAL